MNLFLYKIFFFGVNVRKIDFRFFFFQIIDEILKINEDIRVYGFVFQIFESSFSNKVFNVLKLEKDVDG